MVKVWVARLIISHATAQKLIRKHHIDPDDVTEALVCVRSLRGHLDDHPVRGLRVLVEFDLRGDRCMAVLYPTDNEFDVFRLGSCYEL